MTLAQDAERNRLALIEQLYDRWGGYYVLCRLLDGQWHDVRPLSKSEAIVYRLRGDEAVEIIAPGRTTRSNVCSIEHVC